MNTYPLLVAALRDFGEIDYRAEWLDYQAHGIGTEHVPDLIRVVRDWQTHRNEPAPAGFVPIHAWRTLAQLRTAEASEAMLQVLREEGEYEAERRPDWMLSECPELFEKIGPGALTALSSALVDASLGPFQRWAVAEAIGRVGAAFPRSRKLCLDVLAWALTRGAENDRELNGGIVIGLKAMKAVEVAGVIERAYAVGHVNGWAAGNWEAVRAELGLSPPSDK